MPGGTLKNWVYEAPRGKLGEVGKNQKPLTELEWSWHASSVNWSKSDGARFAKESGDLLCEGVAVKYGRMEELPQRFPVALMS